MAGTAIDSPDFSPFYYFPLPLLSPTKDRDSAPARRLKPLNPQKFTHFSRAFVVFWASDLRRPHPGLVLCCCRQKKREPKMLPLLPTRRRYRSNLLPGRGKERKTKKEISSLLRLGDLGTVTHTQLSLWELLRACVLAHESSSHRANKVIVVASLSFACHAGISVVQNSFTNVLSLSFPLFRLR